MTMLSRIGAGMREAVPAGVFMQFLLIGAMCPRFGTWLEAWLFVEERLAAGSSSDAAGFSDGSDGDVELRSGWISQDGPVWRWRQVTRFGSVLVIPILWFVGRDDASEMRADVVRAPDRPPVSVSGRWWVFSFCLVWSRRWSRRIFVPAC
jgi:hypothetical protein